MLLRRFKIVGHSMSPSFQENENVLASNFSFMLTRPKVGDVVVFEKFNKMYIKRVSEIKNDKYFLVGDNKNDSLDSRRFGLVTREQIKGKVIHKF